MFLIKLLVKMRTFLSDFYVIRRNKNGLFKRISKMVRK